MTSNDQSVKYAPSPSSSSYLDTASGAIITSDQSSASTSHMISSTEGKVSAVSSNFLELCKKYCGNESHFVSRKESFPTAQQGASYFLPREKEKNFNDQ